MKLIELLVIGISLGADSFAVSVGKGLSMIKMSWVKAVIVGSYFGGFQAGMTGLGFLLGVGFQTKILAIGNWIAFVLLLIIGLNMIKESFSKEQENTNDNISFKEMIVLAVATSIDALAVGVSLVFLKVNIYLAMIIIGITAFAMSIIGVKVGNIFGNKYEKKAEFIGGLVLVIMAVKILL